jgi:hypothetical protein
LKVALTECAATFATPPNEATCVTLTPLVDKMDKATGTEPEENLSVTPFTPIHAAECETREVPVNNSTELGACCPTFLRNGVVKDNVKSTSTVIKEQAASIKPIKEHDSVYCDSEIGVGTLSSKIMSSNGLLSFGSSLFIDFTDSFDDMIQDLPDDKCEAFLDAHEILENNGTFDDNYQRSFCEATNKYIFW